MSRWHDPYSVIEITMRVNALGLRESETFRIVGDSPYVLVGRLDDAKTGDVVKIGPFNLLVVERRWEIDGALCVRADRFGALRIWVYRATRWLDWAYRRCIITLAVWGLADYQQASIPSWRDIRALKRWAK